MVSPQWSGCFPVDRGRREQVGGTPDDIQILRLYLPGFESGPEADLVGRVLVDTFGSENPPPSSWIGVQALAQPEYLVEVEAMQSSRTATSRWIEA